MARIRSVHPDICLSQVMADLPAELERTFVRLWTHCDDEGRCVDNPKLIKAALYPLHDAMTAARVDKDLAALDTAGLILRYSVNGTRVLAVCSWSEYQHPQRATKSKLPAFDASGAVREPSANTQRALHAGVGVGEGVGEGAIAPKDSSRNGHGKKPDPLWDALIAACGITTADITPSSRGGYNKALKEIRDAGATCEDISARARLHRAKWNGASLTPTSLAKHWAELGSAPKRQSEPRSDFQEAEYVDEPF